VRSDGFGQRLDAMRLGGMRERRPHLKPRDREGKEYRTPHSDDPTSESIGLAADACRTAPGST
jgi:hypothetical protein